MRRSIHAKAGHDDRVIALYLIWRLMRKPMHAYELIDEMAQLGLGACKPSTLYAVLARLEKKGLITCTRRVVSGRTRKVYATSPEGKMLFRSVRERIRDPLKQFLRDLI
ncbi:MAG: PadR family transcriptional regulator [Candidatus Micrarchaeia archaeon]